MLSLTKKGTALALSGVATLALTTGLNAQADTTPANTAATTTSTAEAVAPSIREKLSLSYSNVFYGPSITGITSGKQPDADTGANTSPLLFKNYLALGYKATSTISITPTIYFKVNNSGTNMLQMQDPYLRISNSKLLTIGNFNHYADIRLAPGVTPVSTNANRLGFVVTKHVSTYSIPESKFTVGLTTIAQVNVYSQEKSGQKNFEVYAGPNVEYQALPNLAIGLLYELAAHNARNKGLGNWNSDGTDLEPYLSWDITPSINFNPWLDIKTGNRIALDTTSFGAAFTWKLL